MSGITPQRRRQAQRGQEAAVASRPRCKACGKRNMSARHPMPESMGSVRVCRSCGHEQGQANGRAFG